MLQPDGRRITGADLVLGPPTSRLTIDFLTPTARQRGIAIHWFPAPDLPPVSVAEVERFFASNNDRVRELILRLVPKLDGPRECPCPHAMEHAFIGGGG